MSFVVTRPVLDMTYYLTRGGDGGFTRNVNHPAVIRFADKAAAKKVAAAGRRLFRIRLGVKKVP